MIHARNERCAGRGASRDPSGGVPRPAVTRFGQCVQLLVHQRLSVSAAASNLQRSVSGLVRIREIAVVVVAVVAVVVVAVVTRIVAVVGP